MNLFNANAWRVFWVGTFLAVALVGGPCAAQDKFPTKPINFIVCTTAGGGQDTTARVLQPLIEKSLGQPVTILNKPGAANYIGYMEIANAAPDGYTFGQANPSLLILKYMMKNTTFDYRMFEPIFYAGHSQGVLLVRTDSRWKNLGEIVDYAKANPGKLRVGNAGYGSISHMVAIGMEHAAKVKFIHIPYKGSMPNVTALMGGHIDASVSWITDTLDYVKGGKLKALGVTAQERSKFVPEAQTFKELGFNVEMVTFYSWIAPKGVPKERINILANAFKKAVESKEFNTYCDGQGVSVSPLGTEEFGKFLAKEDRKWREIIEIGGIKGE